MVPIILIEGVKQPFVSVGKPVSLPKTSIRHFSTMPCVGNDIVIISLLFFSPADSKPAVCIIVSLRNNKKTIGNHASFRSRRVAVLFLSAFYLAPTNKLKKIRFPLVHFGSFYRSGGFQLLLPIGSADIVAVENHLRQQAFLLHL